MINYALYKHIPSVKYRKYINPWMSEVQKIPHFFSSGVFIVLHNTQTTLLSMNTNKIIDYYESGLHRSDITTKELIKTNLDVCYKDEYAIIDTQQIQLEQLRKKHNLNQVYTIFRECDDCYIAATCNANNYISNPKKFHQQTIDAFEYWLEIFLNDTIDIYGNEIPSLRTSRFYQDKQFRKSVIYNRDRTRNNVILSHNESACLYWAMQGKTAEETAIILSLSIDTITTYRKRAVKKLHANNLTHAVLIARNLKIIV